MSDSEWDAHMGASYLLKTAAELMRDYDFDDEARELASGASLALNLGSARSEASFRETLARVLSWEPDQIDAAVSEVLAMIEGFRSAHKFVEEEQS